MDLFEDIPQKKQHHIIGDTLEKHSVEELDNLIAELEAEIERVKVERAKKQKANASADAVFKF